MTIPAQRLLTAQPTIDREQRTIRAQVATRALARDGGILQTENCILDYYRGNPVVQFRHGFTNDRMPVVGRCLELIPTELGLDAVIQFADTELGKESAYLYGLNDAEEVYCRGWSFGWETLRYEFWTVADARRYVPSSLWDERLVQDDPGDRGIWVATLSEMTEFSVVPVGADRHGLSRAFGEGIQTAGRCLEQLNVQDILSNLRELKHILSGNALDRHTESFQTIMRDGTSLATRVGDSGDLAKELNALAASLKPKHKMES